MCRPVLLAGWETHDVSHWIRASRPTVHAPWYGRGVFPTVVPARNRFTLGVKIPEEVVFVGELRRHPPQQQAAAVALRHQLDNPTSPSCIVALPCGYGKTPWFVFMFVALKRTALFLVHKLPLLDQAMEEVRRFAPAARVGWVKSTDQVVDNVDFVVASIQTLHSHLGAAPGTHPYLEVLFARTGLLGMDEGHHAVASTFSAVFNACPARFRLVLTATPRRKDKLMPQLQMIAGPVVFRAFRQVKEVFVVPVEYKDPGTWSCPPGCGSRWWTDWSVTRPATGSL